MNEKCLFVDKLANHADNYSFFGRTSTTISTMSPYREKTAHEVIVVKDVDVATQYCTDKAFDTPVQISSIGIDNPSGLQVKNCDFISLALKQLRSPKLTISKSQIDDLLVFKSRVKEIIISDCICKTVRIDNLPTNLTKLTIRSSCIESIIISDFDVDLLDIQSVDTDIGAVNFIRGSSLGALSIVGAHVGNFEIELLPDVKLSNRPQIDTLSVSRLDLSTIKHRIEGLDPSDGIHRITDLQRDSIILLALYRSFKEREFYHEMDECLLLLRKSKCMLHMLKNNSVVHKSIYVVKYFVLGIVFGWGIRIRNPIISAFLLIFVFGLCEFAFSLNSGDSLGFVLVKTLSNFTSLLDIDIETLALLHLIEHLLGLVFVTLITGVLLRKIIR